MKLPIDIYKCYKYSYIGKRTGLMYAFFILIIFVPVPYWSNLCTDKPFSWYMLLINSLIAGLVIYSYLDGDRKNRKLFHPIFISEDDIKTTYKNDKRTIRWDEIIFVRKINSYDKEKHLTYGLEGICLVTERKGEIFIFDTLDDYKELKEIIINKLRGHAEISI